MCFSRGLNWWFARKKKNTHTKKKTKSVWYLQTPTIFFEYANCSIAKRARQLKQSSFSVFIYLIFMLRPVSSSRMIFMFHIEIKNWFEQTPNDSNWNMHRETCCQYKSIKMIDSFAPQSTHRCAVWFGKKIARNHSIFRQNSPILFWIFIEFCYLC